MLFAIPLVKTKGNEVGGDVLRQFIAAPYMGRNSR